QKRRATISESTTEATMFMINMVVISDLEKIRRTRRDSKVMKVSELGFCRRSAETKKMLIMKDDPTISMKTQGRATDCPARKPDFCVKIA
ncbi:MAG: hypothetical protein ACLQVG_07795, partial [Terriglobia bacterium]